MTKSVVKQDVGYFFVVIPYFTQGLVRVDSTVI